LPPEVLAIYQQNLPTASQSAAAASHQQRHDGTLKNDATLKDEKMKTPSYAINVPAWRCKICDCLPEWERSHGQEGFQTWARIFRGHEPWTMNSKH